MGANNLLGVPSRLRTVSYLELDTYTGVLGTGPSANYPRFANKVEHTGSAFTYTDDTVYGATIVIGEDGIYAGSMSWNAASGGPAQVAIIYRDPNHTAAFPTTENGPKENMLAFAACAGTAAPLANPVASFCKPLPAGTILNFSVNNTPYFNKNVKFTICKIA